MTTGRINQVAIRNSSRLTLDPHPRWVECQAKAGEGRPGGDLAALKQHKFPHPQDHLLGNLYISVWQAEFMDGRKPLQERHCFRSSVISLVVKSDTFDWLHY